MPKKKSEPRSPEIQPSVFDAMPGDFEEVESYFENVANSSAPLTPEEMEKALAAILR